MLFSLQSMIGYPVRATDGDVGTVSECYFDDADWAIRYMVVETKNWLSGRKVLIAPVALGKPDWRSRTIPVTLTCVQVRNSPDIDTERPLYRQHEVKLHDYYQWPRYWEGAYGGTFGITPYPLYEGPLLQEPSESVREDSPHLRSTRQITGYRIHATDGEIGQVEDFIVDDETWTISNLVVNTGNWLSGKKVLLSPAWIKTVHWADAAVYLDRTRQEVKNSPEFSPLMPV
ncbi:MAG: PRC-barrel domain-containing protein [Chitinispirillaceae bacterium]|nr:PRC-barrel domain-containing protein [Chitinispirillaceae bacterium]